ncbi:E3 CR1-alpha [Human mastadenovirus B]|uniref:E3 CR1-alpha n=1 Tax=Human mastadenovirus B TaxID=108098 RepID=A0A1C8EHQ1_9ADEN|nr:E3 CR1-alpha [Human mastadenovirus B]
MKAFAVLCVLSLIKTELRLSYGLPLFQPGFYNQKNETFPVVQDSVNFTFPTHKLEAQRLHRFSRSIFPTNTTFKTGGELHGLPTENPWVEAGLVVLGILAGGLVIILCYLYTPCFTFLVVLWYWFKKWGPY